MIRLRYFSFRFAEQVLNARLAIKQEIEAILQDPSIPPAELSRPRLNELLDQLFTAKGSHSVPLPASSAFIAIPSKVPEQPDHAPLTQDGQRAAGVRSAWGKARANLLQASFAAWC